MGEEGKVHRHSFYGGSLIGVPQDFENPINHAVPARSIALTTNPQTANQLKEVMTQLNTGARAVEINLLTPQVSEAIPKQHLDEINRLSKLVGAELNVHGVLVEPTGISDQGRWDEQKRVQAERQMWNALEQAHRISPDRNVVVTFHSSNGLPEPETWERVQDPKTGEWSEVMTNIGVADESNGNFGAIPAKIKKNIFTDEEPSASAELARYNKEQWSQQVANTNIELNRINIELGNLSDKQKKDSDEKLQNALYLFKLSRTDPDAYQTTLTKEEEEHKGFAAHLKQRVQELNYADSLAKDSYRSFQKLFNDAYGAAERTIAYKDFAKDDEQKKQIERAEKDKARLEKLKQEIAPLTKKMVDDPEKVFELAEHVQKGMQVLGSLEAPTIIRPIREFALDKASETFSNLALQSYQEFKDKAPIISIENPPVGMGMSRAKDIRDLVELSQKKLKNKLIEGGIEEDSAKSQAKKLIGATWDVGHINMLRKRGYTEKDIVEETKKIAPFVKNIHMSDNFGLDHTELPMGMGNVPMQEHLQVLQKAHGKKLDEIKKIVEVGHWYTNFSKNAPFAETLAAFGSPIYGMTMQPYWNQGMHQFGGYFAGYGLNPDTHHSIYGAGFSTLPVELGGQVQGGKSRLSGAPIE